MDIPPVRPRTTYCKIDSPESRHAFTQEDCVKYAADPAVRVIVTHGRIDAGAEFELRSSAVERVPVFVHESRAVAGIRLDALKKVFVGQICDWSELGSRTGKIQIYLHGGRTQRQAFEAVLTQEGVEIRSMASAHRIYHMSYDGLAGHSAEDRDALVVGLRDLRPKRLRAVPIDGKAMSLNGSERYPLQISVAVLTRKSALSDAEINDLVGELR